MGGWIRPFSRLVRVEASTFERAANSCISPSSWGCFRLCSQSVYSSVGWGIGLAVFRDILQNGTKCRLDAGVRFRFVELEKVYQGILFQRGYSTRFPGCRPATRQSHGHRQPRR